MTSATHTRSACNTGQLRKHHPRWITGVDDLGRSSRSAPDPGKMGRRQDRN
jgi:hypothetical protein